MIAIDLSKQQAPDADLKSMQQISLTGNLVREGDRRTRGSFSLLKKQKKLF